MKTHYIIPIFVPHKGCPHDCVFCNQKHITGQINEIDNVFVTRQIEDYLKTIKRVDSFIEVSFYGGSFTGLPVDVQLDLLKPAKNALDSGKIDAIRLSTRPDYIDNNILNILKQYGVSIIELGVQSMDNEVLTLSNRGHTKEDVYKSAELIKENGFTLGLQMMVGLPGDCEKKDLYAADEFIKIMPDMVRIYPALVIKDTYMEQMYHKGQYKPLTVDTAVNICSKLYLKFESKGIKIIRIGLQPTENMTPGKDIVVGPYHPALRELVESCIINEIILYLYNIYKGKKLKISVNPACISKLYADKKKYFNKLLHEIPECNIKIIQDNNIAINNVLFTNEEISQIMSIKDYSLII